MKLLLLLLLTSCASQTVIRTEDVSQPNAQYAASLGMQTAHVFYGWTLNRDEDLKWDGPDRFLVDAESRGLKPDYTGHIVLDVEGYMEEQLMKGSVPARDEMLAMLRFVQRTYPWAKVGFYGVPVTDYYSSDKSRAVLDAKQAAYEPLIREVTAFYPSLYQYFDVSEGPTIKADNLEYLRFNVRNVLSIRGAGSQPVFVFTWRRFHPCCTPKAGELIPQEDFKEQLRVILDTTLNDKRVDGLMWWGADYYDLRTVGNTYAPFVKECGSDRSLWLQCIDAQHKQTIDLYHSIMPR